MRWQVSCLDIDGSVSHQTRLSSRCEKVLHLSEYEQDLRMWPGKKGLQAVRSALKSLDSSRRQIVFMGSGDLNQISALLIENLPEAVKPVNIVLFDNHPDWFDLPPRYHCGNWVGTILKNEWVESVTLLGQDSDDLKGRDFWFSPFEDLASGRLKIFPYENNGTFVPLKGMSRRDSSSCISGVPFGCKINFRTVSQIGIEELAEMISNDLADKNVYIAIDKDVLRPADAMTDWEQGRLSLDELIICIKALCKKTNVIGVDVCGERSPRRLQGLIKNIDAGRLFEKQADDFEQATQVNEACNLALLDALLGSEMCDPDQTSNTKRKATACLS